MNERNPYIDQFSNKLSELEARIKIAANRQLSMSNKLESTIEEMSDEQFEVIEASINATNSLINATADQHWIEAMEKAGLDTYTKLKIWETKDQLAQNRRDVIQNYIDNDINKD